MCKLGLQWFVDIVILFPSFFLSFFAVVIIYFLQSINYEKTFE